MKNLEKVAKPKVLAILALVVFLILVLPIPVSRSRLEIYATTETYYDESLEVVNETVSIAYAVNETLSIPYQVAKAMEWYVKLWECDIITCHLSYEGPLSVGPTFNRSFTGPSGSVLEEGFDGEASFYQETRGLYELVFGSSGGVRSMLILDEITQISLGASSDYIEKSVELEITPGWHMLKILFSWQEDARLYFNVDKGDLFIWEETEYLTIEVPRIHYSTIYVPRIQVHQIPKQRITVANRTITETAYMSILEYLLKGDNA